MLESSQNLEEKLEQGISSGRRKMHEAQLSMEKGTSCFCYQPACGCAIKRKKKKLDYSFAPVQRADISMNECNFARGGLIIFINFIRKIGQKKISLYTDSYIKCLSFYFVYFHLNPSVRHHLFFCIFRPSSSSSLTFFSPTLFLLFRPSFSCQPKFLLTPLLSRSIRYSIAK